MSNIRFEALKAAFSHKPAEVDVPEGRVKPWGTAQAVLSAAEKTDTPFAVINAELHNTVIHFITI